MSLPPSVDKQKYDDLLAKFLANNQPVPEEETREMERWLSKASDRLRSPFQEYRGMVMHTVVSLNDTFYSQIR